jgi:hypothetical protein
MNKELRNSGTQELRNDSSAKGASLRLAKYPCKLLHYLEFGVFLGAVLALAIHSAKHKAYIPKEIGEEQMIELPTRELPEPDGIGTGETIIDTDEDGIPDAWETQFGHNPSDASDADSDFDLDGVTALQEYQLYVSSNGSDGNPLGNYVAENVLPPSGYATTPSVTLVETAANGIILARVSGVLTGSTVSSTLHYIFRPIEKTWTKVTPPSGVTASITCLDVNSLGQVAGYYSQSGGKGFIWTPSTSDLTAGSASPYVINPTSSTPLQAIPVKISNTGYSLYANRPGGVRMPADHKRRAITPVSNPWTSVTYLDVNDYGEYIGTVYDPYSLKIKTFLVIPEGMLFVTAMGYDDLPVSASSVVTPNVDLETLHWEYPSFTYPDDWYDENGNYVDPYARNSSFEFAYATDATTGLSYIFRKGYNYNYGSYYSTGNLIYFREDDGTSIVSQGYLEWQGFNVDLQASPAALNDWGEFSGKYSRVSGYAYDYNDSEGFYTEGYETAFNGSFIYDGKYKVFQESTTINNINNQKQVLSTLNGSYSLYSDGIIVPLTKLASSTNYPRACRLSDNGVITTLLNTGLRILRPNNDIDADGLPDDWERLYGLDPSLNDALGDGDGDGMNNYAEFYLGTNPTIAPVLDGNGEEVDMRAGIDSDGDGIPNTWEHVNGMDYLDPADAGMDFDRDGFSNLKEFQLGTDHRGAPSYQIHQPGPFADTLYPTILQAQLGTGRNAATCLLPPEPSMRDDLFFCVTPAGYSGGQIPAVWRKNFGSESGSFVTYPDSATLSPCSTIASASSGAYLGQTNGSHCEFHYWASPTANLISLSGSSEQNDISSLSAAKFSPAASYLTASRFRVSEGSVAEFIIWKMPLSETQTWTPVVLPSPAGVSLVEGQMIHVNDYGFAVGAGIDQTGKTVAVLWELNAAGTAVSTTQLQTLASDGWATVIGITNQSSPIIVGNALSDAGQMRAVAWTLSGAITSLGTLADGNYSEAIALSPAGFIAGKANTVKNGNPVTVPFIANPPQVGADYRLIQQEYDNESFQIYSIADSGEVLGIGHIYTPEYRQVPIIWSHGKSHTLDAAIPPSTGYVLDAVQHINSNGSLLATAWKDNALVKLLLTADRDTDGDGMPDAYENLNDFNPYLANNAEDDADSDGLSDLNEFRYATDARNPDSDGDGMKDGWEVDWGFLPLDPSDADLDPDQDRVTNLRESQIGTSPTGYYKVETILTDEAGQYPSLHSVNDAGNIIHTGETLYDSGINEDMSLFSSQTQAYHGLTQGATTPVHLPSYVNSYTYNEDWTLYNVLHQSPSFYLDSASTGVHGFVTETYYGSNADGSYFFESSYLIPDAVSQVAQESWIPWTTIEYNLQNSYDADSYPALGYDQALSPYAEAVSPDGNRRIHRRSDGVSIVLDAFGIYVSTLRGANPWNVINHQGDAAGVSYSAFSQPDGSQITIPEVIVSRNGALSHFPLIEAVNANVTLKSFADDGKLHVCIENHSEHGQWRGIDYLLNVNDGSVKRIRMPGLGNESVQSLSRSNGMTVGYGPKPFITTTDGTCIRIEALRIKNQISDTPISFCEMHPAGYSVNHISSSGVITVTTTNQVDQIEFLRLSPHNDADGDGIPDDWEIQFAMNMLSIHSESSHWGEEKFESLLAGNVDAAFDYTGDGESLADIFLTHASVDLPPALDATYTEGKVRNSTMESIYAPADSLLQEEELVYGEIREDTGGSDYLVINLDDPSKFSLEYFMGFYDLSSWSEAKIEDANYLHNIAFPVGLSSGYFFTIDDETRDDDAVLKGGLARERMFRICKWSMASNQDEVFHYVKITVKRDINDSSVPQQVIDLVPEDIVIKKGRMKSDWISEEARVENGYMYETSLVPISVNVSPEGGTSGTVNGPCFHKDDLFSFSLVSGPDIEPDAKHISLLQYNTGVQWQHRRLKRDGSFSDWSNVGRGFVQGVVLGATEAGIYQLRAQCQFPNGQTQTYDLVRYGDADYASDSAGNRQEVHKKGSPDYYALTDYEWQVTAQKNAARMLGNQSYARNAKINVNGYWGVDGPGNHNYRVFDARSDKCNLFVYHKINDSVDGNKKIPPVRNGGPPMAIDWWNDNSGRLDNSGRAISSVDIPNWTLAAASEFVQAGWVCSRAKLDEKPNSYSAHCGIMDYDGSWISAGVNNVNKYCHIFTPQYQPLHLKK